MEINRLLQRTHSVSVAAVKIHRLHFKEAIPVQQKPVAIDAALQDRDVK